MEDERRLKNRVRELRQRLGLRQADLAAQIGVTRQTVLAIEKGRLNPSVFISLKIARVLREPVDYIFFLAPAEDEIPVPAATNKNEPEKPAAIFDLPEPDQKNENDEDNPSDSIFDFV